jgi:hypothetical protein
VQDASTERARQIAIAIASYQQRVRGMAPA